MKQRVLAILLTVALLVSMSTVALAAEDAGGASAASGELIADTEVPNTDTEVPADDTEVPADDTEVPADDTEVPADDTEVPADDTEVPADDTEVPADDTEVPADDTEVPADDTEVPADDTEEPADDTEEPEADIVEPEEALATPHTHSVCGSTGCSHQHTDVSWEAITAEADFASMTDGGYYYLDANIATTTTITINGTISLCLNGKTIEYTGQDYNSVITLTSGAFNLCDCGSGGKLTGGTGKYVSSTGNYDDTRGGGVYITTGTFTMWGGSITGNHAGSHFNPPYTHGFGGGVFVSGGSSAFVMNGGSVTNNWAGYHGGGVYLSGAATLTMYGGTISNNKTSGFGGGVQLGSGTFSFYGGSIAYNETGYYGAGICLWGSGTVNMYSGAEVRGNKNPNKYGGGIFVNLGTFNMYGGLFTENVAGSGGGIYIWDQDYGRASTFNMYDGTVTGNSAGAIGGVLASGCNFTMSGGTVTGNTADEIGGMYIAYCTFNLADDVKITGNTQTDGTASNVCLEKGHVINVTGELTGETSIGVSMGSWTGSSAPETGTFAKPGGDITDLTPYQTYFTSDRGHFVWPVANGANTDLELVAAYNIILSDSIDGGTVTSSVAKTVEGGPVVLTVTPYAEHVLGTVTVTNNTTGEAVPVTQGSGGAWSFNMPASDVTVSVTFPRVQYTVSYDLNGGTGADGADYSSRRVDSGASIAAEAAPAREGYKFLGYSDGTKTYQAGDTITVSGNITLTAQWELIKAEPTPTPTPTPDPTPDPTPTDGPVNTGDDSPILMYSALLLMCIAAAGMLLLLWKRKRD